MACQSGEIQPIHCRNHGIAESGKNVPENSVIGSSTKRISSATWPVSCSSVATYAMIGTPNASAAEHRDRHHEDADGRGTAPNSTMTA